jgi:hypothetical protein
MVRFFVGTVLLANLVVRAQESREWHDPSNHQVQFVTVEDGIRLEVLDWGGSGRPFVLLVCLGLTAHVFDGFAEKLTDAFHVYGVTRRGCGASSRPASGYTEDRLTEDDLRVFDGLKLVALVVAGHSVAGNKLSQLGIHHYERIGVLAATQQKFLFLWLKCCCNTHSQNPPVSVRHTGIRKQLL